MAIEKNKEIVHEKKFDQALDLLRDLTGWALRIAIIILLAVIAWRMAWASFNLDLSKFNFSDLLAMILALFAVGMSVAFYFKTTDSSNQFYDNIYNFTQKTSEILGRIEERFGERLKHLDEGYFKMQSRFDNFSKTPKEIEEKVRETEGKEEEEKEKLKETNKALEKMMNELYEKAQMQEQQKNEFNHKLNQLTTERDAAQERIREMENDRDRMRQQLQRMERDMMTGFHEIEPFLIEEFIRHPEMRRLIFEGAPIQIIKRKSRRILSRFPEEILMRLKDEGIINSDQELTSAGLIILKTASLRFLH